MGDDVMKIDIDNYVDEMQEDEYEEANDGTKRLLVDLSRLADDILEIVKKNNPNHDVELCGVERWEH